MDKFLLLLQLSTLLKISASPIPTIREAIGYRGASYQFLYLKLRSCFLKLFYKGKIPVKALTARLKAYIQLHFSPINC